MTYSWVEPKSGYKNPDAYDFGDAKKDYLEKLASEAAEMGPREYSTKNQPDFGLVSPIGKQLYTAAKNVLLFGLDGTRSMQTAPAEFFDRAPLIYQTLIKYRDDIDISFSVIGDARFDKWPAQVNSFGRGVTLDTHLKALKAEGAGGPGIRESYELWGHYILNNCQTPNCEKPFLFLIGDELFYPNVVPAEAKKFLGMDMFGPVGSDIVWKGLCEKYDFFHLRKPYADPVRDAEIQAGWEAAVGPDRVIPVKDLTRFVDVALGIVAKRWGQKSDFHQNMLSRQNSQTAAEVWKSVKLVDIEEPAQESGEKSVLKLPAAKSTKLLEG